MKSGSLKSLTSEDVARLATLSAVGRTLNTCDDLRLGLEGVLASIMSALGADRGLVQLFNPAGEKRLEVARDQSVDPPGQQFAYTHTLFAECVQQRQPLVMLDAAGISASESAVAGRIRSVMLHPISTGSQLLGVLYLDSQLRAGQFRETDLELLGIIADMVAVFLERMRNSHALGKKSKQLEAALEELRKINEQMEESAHETIFKLSLAAEFRDDETGEHVERVSRYSEAVALKLGLPPEFATQFRLASQLHDVGKVGIPDSVLLKPGRFSDYEREIMKQHTTIGAKILAGSSNRIIRLAEEIALTHHEKWDGTGYPRGLSGDTIPLSGRIVAAADVFDALTTERRYKTAWSLDRAFDLLAKEAGSHFDPKVARAFIELRPQIEEIRQRYQAPPEEEVATPLQAERILTSPSEARDLLPSLQSVAASLAQGEGWPSPGLPAALQCLKDLEEYLPSLGESSDVARRLSNLLKRGDLTAQHAPRIAEMLAELEGKLADRGQNESSRRSVLVLDSDPRQREALSIEARKRGISVIECENVAEASRSLQSHRPDLLVVEVLEPGIDDFFRQLAESYAELPVVVLSSESAFSRRLEVARRGGGLYLHKPMPAAAVFAEIEERIGVQHRLTARILTLDDDALVLKVVARALVGQGFEVESLSNPLHLWSALESNLPDLLLLDLEMPTVSGLDICRVVRADPHCSHLPIIVLTSHEDNETYEQALQAGADDVIHKPLDAVRLASRIRAHLSRNAALNRASTRDALTGFVDMRTALHTAAHLFSLAIRQSATFSLCAVRLKNFRQLTQQRGVAPCRELVRKVGTILEQRCRSEDILVHYREDTFLLGLYGSSSEASQQALSSLDARLAQDGLNVQCEIHLTAYPADGKELSQLLQRVESLLDAS